VVVVLSGGGPLGVVQRLWGAVRRLEVTHDSVFQAVPSQRELRVLVCRDADEHLYPPHRALVRVVAEPATLVRVHLPVLWMRTAANAMWWARCVHLQHAAFNSVHGSPAGISQFVAWPLLRHLSVGPHSVSDGVLRIACRAAPAGLRLELSCNSRWSDSRQPQAWLAAAGPLVRAHVAVASRTRQTCTGAQTELLRALQQDGYGVVRGTEPGVVDVHRWPE